MFLWCVEDNYGSIVFLEGDKTYFKNFSIMNKIMTWRLYNMILFNPKDI